MEFMHQILQQLINGISLGSIYALIALGYTMIYGIIKLINFAHGDIYMVGAYLGFYAITLGIPVVPSRWLSRHCSASSSNGSPTVRCVTRRASPCSSRQSACRFSSNTS